MWFELDGRSFIRLCDLGVGVVEVVLVKNWTGFNVTTTTQRCFFSDSANGVRLKYTVMAPEDDHNNTVWIGGSMLASAGALDGEGRGWTRTLFLYSSVQALVRSIH